MPEKKRNWKKKNEIKVSPSPLLNLNGEDTPPPTPFPLKGEGILRKRNIL